MCSIGVDCEVFVSSTAEIKKRLSSIVIHQLSSQLLYSKEDFEVLVTLLASIKGKSLLNGYPSDILTEFVKKHGWHQKEIKQTVSVANNNSTDKSNKSKIELLTANQPIYSQTFNSLIMEKSKII